MAPTAASGTGAPRLPLGIGRLVAADLGALRLEAGGAPLPATLAYRHDGPGPDAPQVLVIHALTGSADAAGDWWAPLIGPGHVFDTDVVGVLCANLLGGVYGSTGPTTVDPATGRPFGRAFPAVSARDEARALWALADALGIERFVLVSGGSLGGMIALEWAVLFPDDVDAIVPIASTHALRAQGVAWNAIARNAITSDPDWQGGDYYGSGRSPASGMAVARMIGHITYLSSEALDMKFGRRLQFADDIRYTLTEPEFQVESYLRHQGEAFVKRFDANTYLCLSRALTYFDLAREHGGGRLADAVRPIKARTLLIAFSSDWLYPPSDSTELAAALRAAGKDVELHVIDAPYGHDCFLLEEGRQIPLIRKFLALDN